jgi:uncharacterized protein YkwD
MTSFVDRFAHRAGTRRQVVRGILGSAAAALGAALPRDITRATSVESYCAGSLEQEFLKLINDYRAANGLNRLSMGQHIGAAAQHHSTDMANRNYLDHTTLGTSDGPPQRMIAHGYPANTTWWGENIYAGYGVQNGVDLSSAQAAFTWWKNSPGHNANMLGSHYVEIGIARVSNPNSTYKNYWTTDFGGVTDQAATLCGGTTPTPTPTPSPTPNPNPTPGRLIIVGSSQSSNSNSARRAIDGDPTTVWRSITGAPASAWAQFDLGSTKSITEIRWQFSQVGFADQFTIQISSNGSSWQNLATRGNASSAGAWQSLSTSASGRYVRFSFSNPNRDSRVGYLSEVQVYGLTAAQTRSARVSKADAEKGKPKQASVPAVSGRGAKSGKAKDRNGKKTHRGNGKRK